MSDDQFETWTNLVEKDIRKLFKGLVVKGPDKEGHTNEVKMYLEGWAMNLIRKAFEQGAMAGKTGNVRA